MEAQRRRILNPLRRRIERAEKAMAELQLRQGDLQRALADDAIYEPAAKERLARLIADARPRLAGVASPLGVLFFSHGHRSS